MAYFVVSLKIVRNECKELTTQAVYAQHYEEHWDMEDKKFGCFEAPVLYKVNVEENTTYYKGNVRKYSVLVGTKEVDNDFGKFFTLGKSLIQSYLGDKSTSLFYEN